MDKQSINWHGLDIEEVTEHLNSDSNKGLSDEEVTKRYSTYGRNILTKTEAESGFKRFLKQFHQPLIYILLGAGAITVALNELVDASVIFGVVLLNAVVGYIQESKAINALEALSKTMVSETIVIRNGKKENINSADVVPGDIVLLNSGDKVPADIRLLYSKELQISESALTGESLPVEKSSKRIDPATLLPDRENMAYASTYVTNGQGKGIVVNIGDNTEVGNISRLMSSVEKLQTPLTRKIASFSHILLYVIIGMAVFTFLIGILRGETPLSMFLAAVALAVGAIPEGLPAALTTILAIGVSRMAKKNAIIRKLPVVETLGSTTIICSDKTGTLTQNQMTVQDIYANDHHYNVSGKGYHFDGNIFFRNKEVNLERHKALNECLIAGLICNESNIYQEEDNHFVQGDPTEGCLIVSAIKGGIDPAEVHEKLPRIDTLPFESAFQYMATLHKTNEEGRNVCYIKGSVEKVLEKCNYRVDNNGQYVSFEKDDILDKVNDFAEKGLRVLVFAKKYFNKEDINRKDIEEECIFLGIQGIIDPPRDEAIKSVKICHQAGIQVKMITGDHALTAKAIAGKLGIVDEKKIDKEWVLTGKELNNLEGEALQEAAAKSNVFARVSPEQKLKLVKALQAGNNVIAMTGDGVNDAPALRQSDIGISMGITGTEVTKEAADMVLTDDNFSSIEAAVNEGRGIFDNLTKFITWTLPTNMGEGLVLLFSILLGFSLPILPLQILWINMTTAGILGLMLAFEPKEKGVMKRPPRDPSQPLIDKRLIIRMLTVSFLLLVGAFGLYQYELYLGHSQEVARTVSVTVFIAIEGFYLFNARSLKTSLLDVGLFSNVWVWIGGFFMLILQNVYIYSPVMNKLFQSAPISLESWLRIFFAGLISFVIVEIQKWIMRKIAKNKMKNSN